MNIVIDTKTQLYRKLENLTDDKINFIEKRANEYKNNCLVKKCSDVENQIIAYIIKETNSVKKDREAKKDAEFKQLFQALKLQLEADIKKKAEQNSGVIDKTKSIDKLPSDFSDL